MASVFTTKTVAPFEATGLNAPVMHRGLLLSAAGAFFGAVYLIPYQAAVLRADRGSVVAAMLLTSAGFNTLVALVREGRTLFQIDRTGLFVSGFLVLMTVVGNTAVAFSLPAIGPGMTSVVLKAQAILIPLLAWSLLREKITIHLGIGALVGFGGVLVMQFGSEALGAGPTIPWWALLAALCFASIQVAVRKVVHHVRLTQVNALRLWLSVGLLLMLPSEWGGGSLELDSKTWLLAALAGLSGPGMSRLCWMFALRYVTASFTALIGLLGPFFAFLLGYLVFQDVPTSAEVIGAGIILLGVTWPLLQRFKNDE